jgi:hypothetical protein
MPPRVSTTFKSALAQFEAECAKVAPKVGEVDTADQAHLARWADDDRAERIWKKIEKLAWAPTGSYEPLHGFIVSVLAARQMAESAGAADRMVERHKERRARHLERALQLEGLAKIWRDTAASDHPNVALALARAKAHEQEARAWRTFAQRPLPQRPFLISRIDKDGSRMQRVFMQLIGKYINELCGRALDSEVAALNDIAFDTAEPTSPFQARSARRPTTRGKRAPANKRLKKIAEAKKI